MGGSHAGEPAGARVAPSRAPSAGAKVTYLGHASFLIEAAGEIIATDPVFSPRIGRLFTRRAFPSTFRPETLPGVSGTLISHGHHDHLDYRSLRRFGATSPVLVPWGLAPALRLHGFTDVRTLRPWDTMELGRWHVTAVPSRHFGGRLPLVHTSGYQGYVLTGPAGIYFAGDTGLDGPMFREIARRFRLDLAILPIAGAVFPWYRRNHMNALDALAAFRALDATRMLPMHFETFPASFEPRHRPRQQLLDGARHLGVADRVTVLAEGDSLETTDPLGPPAPTGIRLPIMAAARLGGPHVE